MPRKSSGGALLQLGRERARAMPRLRGKRLGIAKGPQIFYLERSHHVHKFGIPLPYGLLIHTSIRIGAILHSSRPYTPAHVELMDKLGRRA